MLKRRITLSLLMCFLFSSLWSLSGCSESENIFQCNDTLGCVSIQKSEPLLLGVLQALSGEVEPLGRAQLRGLELALDAASGKILGHDVELKIVDTGCSPEGGANGVLKMIADPQMVAIYGTTCSSAAATASKAMSDSGLTMISGNNSAPFLTSIGDKPAPNWQPGYFRTANNEENAGKVVALYAYHELGVKRAATIHDNDIYTQGLTDGFQKAFEDLGGEIVLKSSINKGDEVMLPVLEAVYSAKPEMLFFPLFQPEGNRILTQSKHIPGFEKIYMISDGALIEETFLRDVGEAALGMYFVGPKGPDVTNAKKMAIKYEAKYNQKPGVRYYMSGYDAAMLLLHAIEKSSVQDSDGTLHIGRQQLRDTLYDIKAFKGVTGNLSCDKFGDCGPAAFNILRMDDIALGLAGLEANSVYLYISE